jgi:glycosyltransferase involved in cell wall biosynthesis
VKVLIVRTWPDQLNINNYNVQEIGLAAALIHEGHQCDIVFYLEEGKSRTEKRTDGITIYWIRGINLMKNGFFPGIRKIMADYDIIQVHEYDQIQSWILYSFPHGKKVVLYHGPYDCDFNKGYNAKCRVFDKVFLPLSRNAKENMLCLTKSPLASDFLLSKGFKKVISVGVGLDTAKFQNAEAGSIIAKKMPDDMCNLVYVGKLEERRNIGFLLELFVKISEKKQNVHFTIIGNGDKKYEAGIMGTIVSLKQSGILEYYPYAAQSELAEVYKKADIMVFPSLYEIYGMVLMEAMYFGTAVVSSANGGATALIDHGQDGIIVNDFQKEHWLAAVLQLIDDPKFLLKLKRNAEVKIKKKFTWDMVAKKFIKIYQEMI